MAQQQVLIVDDEISILSVMQAILIRKGYSVRTATSGEQALGMFAENPADLVITDIRMPGMDGMEVLKRIKAISPLTPVIVLTGHATLEMAVEAFKHYDAFDFLTKPQDSARIVKAVQKALEYAELRRQNEALMDQLQKRQMHLEARNAELHQAQEALEASRKRYQDLYDQAPVGYLTVDREGRILEANQQATELLMTQPAQLIQKFFSDFIDPDSRNLFSDCRGGAGDGFPHGCELILLRKGKIPFHAQIEAKSSGELSAGAPQTLIVLTDITHRKKTEEALRKSEARFRSFMESLQGIAYQKQSDGTPFFIQGAVEAITGYTESDFVGRQPAWPDIVHPQDRGLMTAQGTFEPLESDSTRTLEYRIRHRNGQWRWLREHIQKIRGAEEKDFHFQGVIFDITDYQAMRSQVVESRRLDAIATLAGGVAHQYNNALAGLMGYLELLQMDMKKKGTQSVHVEAIFEQIERMAYLTQQLLAYARGGHYAPAEMNVADFVEQSLKLMRNRIPAHIRMETDLPTDTGFVNADSTQMQMVLLALVDNALEAMREAGRIRISTRNTTIGPDQLHGDSPRRTGSFVRLSVVDEGCGMDEATLKKAFDPFFTTKFIGRGLGLSAAYGIVSSHQGWLEIDSRPGTGTRVDIFLPSIEREETKPAPDPEVFSDGMGSTVLVIEDEAQLMRATRQRLNKLNFQVLEASTGAQAIELAREKDRTIDVVLLDMRLPDIEGEALFEQIALHRPEVKIVLCSGYAVDDPVKKLLAKGARGFLQKPFSLAKLSKALIGAINGVPPPAASTKSKRRPNGKTPRGKK